MPTPQDEDVLPDEEYEPDYEAMTASSDEPCDCGQCMGGEVIW